MYTGSLGAVSNQEDWIVDIALTAADGTDYSVAVHRERRARPASALTLATATT